MTLFQDVFAIPADVDVFQLALRADRTLVVHIANPEIRKPAEVNGFLNRFHFLPAKAALHGITLS